MTQPVTLPALPSPEDRELFLKEADWVREDLQDTWRRLETIQAVWLGAVYAVGAWIVGRALSTTEQPGLAPDQVMALVRQRADVALGLCVIPILNTLAVIAMVEAGARFIAYLRRLIELADILSPWGIGVVTWTWRSDVERDGHVKVWRRVFGTVSTLLGFAFTVGGAWFCYPAMQRSKFVWFAWFVSICSHALAWFASGIFSYRYEREIKREKARQLAQRAATPVETAQG